MLDDENCQIRGDRGKTVKFAEVAVAQIREKIYNLRDREETRTIGRKKDGGS